MHCDATGVGCFKLKMCTPVHASNIAGYWSILYNRDILMLFIGDGLCRLEFED